jgi:hypothetical protein
MFETAAAPVETPAEFLRKPVREERTGESDTGILRPHPYPAAPGRPEQAFGPYCPACRHRNPASRVRCEVCATELWPGAAAPVRRRPAPIPPAVPLPPPRRRTGLIVLTFALAGIAALTLVYLLAYALG